MNKGRGKEYASREDWLAVRNSDSLAKTLSNRERYIHISVSIVPPIYNDHGREIVPARASNDHRYFKGAVGVTYKKPESDE